MASYDPVAINDAASVLTLAEHDTRLRRVSGGEYAGPCPKCGGTDRFHATASWWFCRRCHAQRGDAIEYLRWRDGLTFPEACAALGGEKAAARDPRAKTPRRSAPRVAALPTTAAPSAAWQARARAMVAHCEALLWADPEALAYLTGRGLRDDTIKAAHLGWCPGGWKADDPARWGLDRAKYPRGIRPPRGWVIPCEMGGELWYVKVRRPQADLDAEQARGRDPAKYLCLPGSCKRGAIYGLDTARGATDVLLVEGELNALTVRQELAGVAAVVSMGDAGNRPGAAALRVLGRVPRPWAAYDHDKAGEDGAAALGELWARVRPLAWPWADRGDKYDVNDAHRAGEDLAAWAIPQLGPPDPDKRRAWLEHHLRRLDDAALEAGADDTIPALRAWLALWGELEALAPARRRVCQNVTARDMAAAPLVGSPPTGATSPQAVPSPGGWNPPRPAGDPAWPSDPDWPGPGWWECAAPDDAPPEAAHHRRWATNGAGRWVSAP